MNKFLRPKNICLIQAHTSFQIAGNSALFDQFDSIGLLSLSSYLKSKGYCVNIIHMPKALKLGYSLSDIQKKISEINPILVGINMMWLHQSVGAIETAELVKRTLPHVPIVLGGQQASFFSEEIIKSYYNLFDGVIVGEGEETIHEIALSIQETGEIDCTIPGFLSLNGAGELRYSCRNKLIDIDTLPLMSHFDVWPYIEPNAANDLSFVAALDTVRGGCPNKCTHCLEADPIGKLGRCKRQFHSPEYLVEQLKSYIKQGKRQIFVQDSFYANKNSNIEEFVCLSQKSGIELDAIHFFVEPGYINRDLFPVIASFPAKKVTVDYGIETGSPRIARNMGRFYNYDDMIKDVECLGQLDILATAWWLIGLPGEMESDIALTEQLLEETINMGVFAKRVSQVVLFPQTPLYLNANQYGITPFFHTFEDFKKFSLVEKRDDGIYPELITHESVYQSKQDTLFHLRDIKKKIITWIEASSHHEKIEKYQYKFRESAFF